MPVWFNRNKQGVREIERFQPNIIVSPKMLSKFRLYKKSMETTVFQKYRLFVQELSTLVIDFSYIVSNEVLFIVMNSTVYKYQL